MSSPSKSTQSGCGGPVIVGDLTLKNLLKKIGKEPRLAKDLTRVEASAALTQILEADVPPEQAGAFLIAARIKSETAEETAGFIDALRAKSIRVQTGLPKLLELASAHDGKSKTLVLSPFVGAILAGLGIPVVLTGGVDVPTKKGVTARHIFEALNWPTRNSAEAVVTLLKSQRLAYWDVADFCPSLESLKPLRDNLGLRTGLNTVEKAINPAGATHICTGVFHGPYLKDLAEALSLAGERNVLCLQASEGSSDLPLKKRTLYRQVQNGALSDQLEIDPAPLGLKHECDPGYDANESAESSEDDAPVASIDTKALALQTIAHVRDALMTQQGLVYDALIYNVGVQLWFVGECDSVTAGIARARSVLQDQSFCSALIRFSSSASSAQ